MSSPASSEVISLASRAGFRVDYRGIASSQLRGAREKMRMDPESFAACLADLVGWDVDPDVLTRWERGRGTPPVDVVLAARDLAGEESLEPSGVLLRTVPGGFPAQALAGYWLTCFTFTHAGAIQYHADVAQVTAEAEHRITVTNDAPEPRTEGRPSSPFRNEIEAHLRSRHLMGEWKNTNDQRYFGQLQLAVLPGETIMEGYYLGFGSDISVSFGTWKWVRVGADVPPDLALREPAALHALAAGRSPYDPPLAVDEIGEDG
jgi:hypothetical protein